VRFFHSRLCVDRLCKVLFGGCFDDYQIIPVPELANDVQWVDKSESLALTFACNHTWVSSDKYLITIESKTSSFKAQSEKFTVRNSKGKVELTQPSRAGTTIAYYAPFPIKWKTTNAVATTDGTNIGFTISLVAADGTEAFKSEVVAANEFLLVLQESDAPVGAYELTVVEASNRDVSTKISVVVAQPAASIRSSEPSLGTIWQFGTPATVTWSVKNVKGDVHLELYNGQTPVQSLGNSSAGTFDVPAVPDIRSGFGFQVRLSGVGLDDQPIETFSPYFQLRGSDYVGGTPDLCVISSTNSRMAVCKDPRGRPLLNFGALAVFELQFLWQTCVSLVGTTLDVSVKYTHYRVAETDVLDDKNFLPAGSARDLAVLDGKSSPGTLVVRLRNVVKGNKTLTPPPGTWEFSTDIFVTPFASPNATAVQIATNLKFVATNPDCKNQTLATAPTRCDPSQKGKCVVPPPEKQKIFNAGTKLCSTFQIGALEKPCGETIVFSKTRASETLTATTGLGEPCSGTFYVEVAKGSQTGYVPSSFVGICPPADVKSMTMTGAASTTSMTIAQIVVIFGGTFALLH
jgi:hypothetical protein